MTEIFEKEIVCDGKIHIHLDLEAVKEADGVTQVEAQLDPSVSHFGAKSIIPDDTPMFKAKDIVTLAQYLTRTIPREKFGGLSISDYNPIIEDQKTGRIVALIFYNLVLGICQQKKINEFNYKELKEIELIGGGRIPSLDELLSSFGNLRFNIDIKSDEAVTKGVEIVKSHNALDKVCLASFSSKRLDKIRKLSGPDLCSSMGMSEVAKLLMKSYKIPFADQTGDCAQVPVTQWGLPVVTSAFIKEAHKQNKFVHVWTIDKEDEMNRLIKLGVDGLMTDKPSVLKKVMEANGLF